MMEMIKKEELRQKIMNSWSPKPEVLEIVYDEETGEYNSYGKWRKDEDFVILDVYDDDEGECLAEIFITPEMNKILNKFFSANSLLDKYKKQMESVKSELDESKKGGLEEVKGFLDGQYYILSEIIKDLTEAKK